MNTVDPSVPKISKTQGIHLNKCSTVAKLMRVFIPVIFCLIGNFSLFFFFFFCPLLSILYLSSNFFSIPLSPISLYFINTIQTLIYTSRRDRLQGGNATFFKWNFQQIIGWHDSFIWFPSIFQDFLRVFWRRPLKSNTEVSLAQRLLSLNHMFLNNCKCYITLI